MPTSEHLRFRRLRLGAVRPTGWLLAQALADLDHGFVGCLDALSPHARRDLFADRCPPATVGSGWWDAETRGNWLWGYAATSHLAGHAEHVARVNALLDALRATRSPGGYIGIYAPDDRYGATGGENGELWAQSRALLPLLARHELTGDPADLAAVEQAVALTMANYAAPRSAFRFENAHGRSDVTGLTHGLCYVDVLEQLHALTGRDGYARDALRLYDDFSSRREPFPNDDLALPGLLARRPWRGHAVHTAEHLRALLFSARISRRTDLAEGVEAAMAMLRSLVLPNGALPGDESIHGVPTPDSAYELCTTIELGLSVASALEQTRAAALGDWLESLFFNAFHGARLPDGCAVAYLSADDRLAAEASRVDAYSLGRAGRRFKFSPTHDDVACCCVPNAGRALPQYVGRMWMAVADQPGLALVAYGPCRLSTSIGGVPVAIESETSYPFEDEVRLRVRLPAPTRFALWLRRPAWAERFTVTGADTSEAEGWVRADKGWSDGDEITIAFGTSPRAVRYANGEAALFRGALQFVVPIDAERHATRRYEGTALCDLDLRPRDPGQACVVPLLDARLAGLGANVERTRATLEPWASPPVRLRIGAITLVPMGAAPLRRAAFPAVAPI